MLTAAAAELIRATATQCRKDGDRWPPPRHGIRPRNLLLAVADRGPYVAEDVYLAALVIDELGWIAALKLIDQEYPIDHADRLITEFTNCWTAKPFKEPDIVAIIAQAQEFGVGDYVQGAIDMFLRLAPMPEYSPEQEAQHREAAMRAIDAGRAAEAEDRRLFLGDDPEPA